jgi:branched-subunit amino acid aminotransferase/4-amino-4-deoxychorismate lyase
MHQRTEVNGQPADVETLAFLAQVNYGHFTSMQVRDGSVRGLGLHLDRLERATRRLFGSTLDRRCVREWLRQAVAGGSVSARVTVFSRRLDRARLEQPVDVDVLVATTPMRDPDHTPLRVRSIVHERVLPETKHVGTFDLLHHWREARLAGVDDVVFTSATGAISEGSIWNIGFWDGTTLVLPSAPSLPGITTQLVEAGLAAGGTRCVRREVRAGRFDGLRSAFAMNSGSPCRPIASIDGHAFALDGELVVRVQAAYSSRPMERI